MIKHTPHFDTDKVVEHYSQKDGVPVKYVCSTDLNASDVPVDVFYRSTPHPEFNNKYFGLYYDNIRDAVCICNADVVEDYEFGMITDKDGNKWYSQSHHDCLFIDGSMIDGGRVYTRWSGSVEYYKVKDGEMIHDTSGND